MLIETILALVLVGGMPEPALAAPATTLRTHTYEVRFRFKSRVSTTQVQASDAGHAKKLVQAQYGDSVTVLSVKKVD